MAVKNFNDVNPTKEGVANTRLFRGHSSVGRDFADSKLYDIELVKQDILNHFNILKGEKLENPNFGTNIWLYLMDPLDDETRNAVIEDGHSGASFALCLRMCQSILNKELNNRK